MIAREGRLFLIALQFLTRLPVSSQSDVPPDWLVRSAKYMPLVGALIGFLAGGLALFSAAVFPEPIPLVIALATAIVITGALHEDGLADTADAFGSSAPRERVIEIMKDSRIGTYGTLVLIVVLALKGAALMPLDHMSVVRVLIAGHAGARLAAVLTLWALPYAGNGVAKVARTPSRMTHGEVGVALLFGVVPGLLVLRPATFLISLIFASVAAALLALYSMRRIGGYTGDVLGAVEQVFETVFFAFAAAVIAGPG